MKRCMLYLNTQMLQGVQEYQLNTDFRETKLINFISMHTEIQELYNRCLLLGEAKFTDYLVIYGDKFAISLDYHHDMKRPYVWIHCIYFHISILDTEKEIKLWDNLEKLELQGNSRDYAFKHKTIHLFNLPYAKLIVEENAFEGLTLDGSSLLTKGVTVENNYLSFYWYAVKNCTIKSMQVMTIESVRELKSKGNSVEYLRGYFSTEIGLYEHVKGSGEYEQEKMNYVEKELLEAKEVVGFMGSLHITLRFDDSTDWVILEESLIYMIDCINDFASKHKIVTQVLLLGSYGKIGVVGAVRELYKDKSTVYTEYRGLF